MNLEEEQLIERSLAAWKKTKVSELPEDIRVSLENAIQALRGVQRNGGLQSIGDRALARLSQEYGNANKAYSDNSGASRVRRLWKKFLDHFGDSVRFDWRETER